MRLRRYFLCLQRTEYQGLIDRQALIGVFHGQSISQKKMVVYTLVGNDVCECFTFGCLQPVRNGEGLLKYISDPHRMDRNKIELETAS